MNTYKCLRALIIFLIIVGWIFSGWPRIWQKPAFPPEVPEAYAATERQSPDAILASANLTPVDVTYIQDDPDTPDANWMTAVANNVASTVRVSFPTPTGNPTVGAGLQEFKAWVRKMGGTGTPTCVINLWENGVLVSAGTPINITNYTGEMVTRTWDATLLGTANGSLVEARVVGTAIGGAPSGRASIEVGAVEWNVDYTPAVSISITNDIVAFQTVALDTTVDNSGDLPEITVDSGPANLNVKSTVFTEGANTWILHGTDNGPNQVLWEFSKNGTDWALFAVAGTEYTFDTNVPTSGTRNLYLRLTMPTETASYNQYSSTVTIVASAP